MRKLWDKYKVAVIITGLFVLFILFLSPNSLVSSARINRNIKKMEREQSIYREQAKQDSAFLEDLKDDAFLEKYARENFYMKRKGEAIYILED